MITAAGVGALVWLVPSAPLTGDGPSYIAYAQSHLQHGAASTWHARRILGPLIVGALPIDPLMGFHVLTLTSLFVAALLTWRAALEWGQATALAAIVFFLGTWAVAPNLREYALVDPLAWAFVAAIWLATVQRRWLLAAVLGGIGVLAKEVVLLAAVAAAAAAWSPERGRQSLLRAAVIPVPALVALALLVLAFPGSGTDAISYVTKWWADGLGSLGPLRVIYLVFASFGALWLLLPRGVLALPGHLRRAAVVFIGAAALLPAIGSPERMEELIFPGVIAAACAATRGRYVALAFILGIANAAFVARVGGDARLPSIVAWLGLALAVALSMVWLKPWAIRRSVALHEPVDQAPRDTQFAG